MYVRGSPTASIVVMLTKGKTYYFVFYSGGYRLESHIVNVVIY